MPKLLPLSATPSSPLESSLRLPANRRIATPVSQRLNSITDPENSSQRARQPSSSGNDGNAAETTPRRRSLANLLPLPFPRRESGSSKISSPAPPYDWVPEPIEDGQDGRVPVEGEKLRQLRRADEEGKTALWWRRRRVLLLAFVTVLLIGMAIGLGVGLSHRGKVQAKDAKEVATGTQTPLEFPLGQWTVPATLVEVNTGCTSKPDIWRCYPYTAGGTTTFDLTIANTSALYAPNNTVGTGAGRAGLPANLTVSSSNPFAIPFANRSLTYVAPSGNASATRLEWSFTMTKSIMPASPLMPDGGAARCDFADTQFEGMLYLRVSAKHPNGSTGREWPYAVEIRQTSLGAGGAVECQGMRGGSVLVPAADGVCSCVYRNY